MPRDKKPKLDESSDSDSGPDDPTPAKKSPAKAAPAAAASTGDRKRPAPKGNPAVEGEEPTWELGQMKKVKVTKFYNWA